MDQQNIQDHKYFGVFYTHYWFAPDQQNSNNLDAYFMVNGDIYNKPLPKQQFNGMNAITPQPPYLYIAQSYENAYQTAFKAVGNVALNKYKRGALTYGFLSPEFISGTFGYQEVYNSILPIQPFIENTNNYNGYPYLFISAGSGGGNGYMYLNWIIATFGVPYEIIVTLKTTKN